MYLFNPLLLARMLRDGALSERQKFHLLVFSMVVQGGDSLVGVFWGRSKHASAIWNITIHLIIVLVGLWFCFRANARGDNRHFVERFFCLSAPLSLWISLVPYALDLALYYGLRHVYGVGVHAIWHRLYPLLQTWSLGRNIGFYIALNFLTRIAASGSPAQHLPPTDAPTLAPIAAP